MTPESTKQNRSGLSLYANLLKKDGDHQSLGTISSGPVVYEQPHDGNLQQETSTGGKSQISSAALRFQPARRPQVSSQKPKSKNAVQRPSAPQTADLPGGDIELNGTSSRTQVKTLADWTAERDEDDVNGYYAVEKRQRGGRKKRKKNREATEIPANWDDIYDPSRPNVYEDYKNSDEKYLEIRDWKARLHAHRVNRHHNDAADESDSSVEHVPSNLRFAPPAQFSPEPKPLPIVETKQSPSIHPLSSLPNVQAPALPIASSQAATGDDAYQRRLQLSNEQSLFLPETSNSSASLPPYPPPSESIATTVPLSPSSQHIPQSSQTASKTAKPDISRAPVRYNLPAPEPELPTSEAELHDAPQAEDDNPDLISSDNQGSRSLRPGQKGFAERLMSKYGWTKGTGLGASGTGMTAPLRVQLEKQKKKPDSEGGGFVGPGGMGKVIGGKDAGSNKKSQGKFGAMSEVVLLRGMLDGMNLDTEMSAGNGGLMQEIGEECGEKYGRVERVYIDRDTPETSKVFIKFTSQLSALRAVNALEGRVFNGNTIIASFYDSHQFESGIYT